MAKRFQDTEIWAEDWFLEMPNEYKLFWFYMLSKCDHAGVFKVNLRSFRGLIEVNLTSDEALQHFNNGKQRIRIISENLWFIEDFIVFQYGTCLNLNNRMHESIAKTLAKNNLSLTSVRGLTDLKDRVKEKEKEKEKERIGKEGVGEKPNGKIRGETFDDLGQFVFFPDGSKQPLGPEQQRSFKEGDFQAHYIVKGKIQ